MREHLSAFAGAGQLVPDPWPDNLSGPHGTDGSCPGLCPGIDYRATCPGAAEPQRFARTVAAVEDGRAVRDRHVQGLHAALPAGGRGRDRHLAQASSPWKQPRFPARGTRQAADIIASRLSALAYAAVPILAAIWVHLYWSHAAGPRYFFPIVLMAAPLAGWGLLQISAALANRVRRQHSSAIALLAGAAPLAVMLVVNLSVAWGGDVRARGGRRPGASVQRTTARRRRMLGPDGITQVVNHYAQGRCESFPETAPPAAVLRQIGRLRPVVVLLSTDRRGSQGDNELSDCVTALGFEAIDRVCLPRGCDKLRVLVKGDKPRS